MNALPSTIGVRFLLVLVLSPGLLCVASYAAVRLATNPSPPREPSGRKLAALKKELEATEARKGRDDAELVPILLSISSAQREQGGYIPALRFAQRGLEIAQKTGGNDSLEVAGALDLVGTLDWLQGDYDSARESYQGVLSIAAKRLGAEHPAYAMALDHLARVYLATGKTAEAETSLQTASTLVTKTFGPASGEAAVIQLTLGELYLRTGRLAKAEQALVYALTIRSEGLGIPVMAGQSTEQEALFGMAPPQNLLGRLYTLAGLHEKAEPFLEDALKAYESQLGKEHPRLEDILVNLAALAAARGDAARGAAYNRRSDENFAKNVGFSHLPGSPRAKLIEPAAPPRSGLRPYAGARVGDWVVYGGTDHTPYEKREIVRMTPVVAVVLTRLWDAPKKKWRDGEETIVDLSADLVELFGTPESDWRHETVSVKGAEVACSTAVINEGEKKCKLYLAPEAVPLGGLVKTECGDQILLPLIDSHRAP